jgi:uncharacterized RmlC-like cupin family protein
MTRRCVLIRPGDASEGATGVTYATGVSTATAGARGLCLELATLPPGASAKAHLHAGHESAAFVLEGELVLRFGDRLEGQLVARPGDFVYIPSGVPHVPANASDVEPAVAILARTDPNEQESVTMLPELDALWKSQHGVPA